MYDVIKCCLDRDPHCHKHLQCSFVGACFKDHVFIICALYCVKIVTFIPSTTFTKCSTREPSTHTGTWITRAWWDKAPALMPSDGFGTPSASTCQPKSFKLTTGGCVWSAAFQNMVCKCARFMCSCKAGSVAGRVLMLGFFFFENIEHLSLFMKHRGRFSLYNRSMNLCALAMTDNISASSSPIMSSSVWWFKRVDTADFPLPLGKLTVSILSKHEQQAVVCIWVPIQ